MRKTVTPYEGKMTIRKGDTVQILAGKDKGQQGKVTAVYPKTGKVIVENLNIVTKHQKGQPTQSNPNPESGRIEVAAPLLVSKVALLNSDGKPTRVRVQKAEDKTITRVAIKGGGNIANP